MQRTELSEHFQQVLYQSDRKAQRINYVLAFLLAATLIWAGYAEWRKAQQEKIESITLVDNSVEVLGPTSLCPGDAMTTRYSLDIDGTGIILVDDIVQHNNQTVIFSQSRRDYIPASSKRTYEDSWTIPKRPEMSANGNPDWVPGLYVRYITVAASNAYVSRYTDPASFSIQFIIREDCPK